MVIYMYIGNLTELNEFEYTFNDDRRLYNDTSRFIILNQNELTHSRFEECFYTRLSKTTYYVNWLLIRRRLLYMDWETSYLLLYRRWGLLIRSPGNAGVHELVDVFLIVLEARHPYFTPFWKVW